MAIKAHVLSEQDFYKNLADFLGQFEGSSPPPYMDTAGHPTIGIGFNLDDVTIRDAVFAEMGITDSKTKQNLVKAILANDGRTQNTIDLTLFNNAYGKTFAMTETQIANVLKTQSKRYVGIAQANSDLPFSSELVALTSGAYNGVIGAGTKNAASMPDAARARAEVWFQIRYGHKNQLQKRRYAEASLFGLYNDAANVSLSDAKAVYAMYTAHKDQKLENGFANMAAYDKAYASKMSEAVKDLAATHLSTASIGNLDLELQPAANAIIKALFIDKGIGAPPGFAPSEILINGGTYQFVSRDSKRNVIGNTVVTVDSSGTEVVDWTQSNGFKRKTIVNADGRRSIEEFDSKGNRLSQMMDQQDGLTYAAYDDTGSITSSVHVGKDGSRTYTGTTSGLFASLDFDKSKFSDSAVTSPSLSSRTAYNEDSINSPPTDGREFPVYPPTSVGLLGPIAINMSYIDNKLSYHADGSDIDISLELQKTGYKYRAIISPSENDAQTFTISQNDSGDIIYDAQNPNGEFHVVLDTSGNILSGYAVQGMYHDERLEWTGSGGVVTYTWNDSDGNRMSQAFSGNDSAWVGYSAWSKNWQIGGNLVQGDVDNIKIEQLDGHPILVSRGVAVKLDSVNGEVNIPWGKAVFADDGSIAQFNFYDTFFDKNNFSVGKNTVMPAPDVTELSFSDNGTLESFAHEHNNSKSATTFYDGNETSYAYSSTNDDPVNIDFSDSYASEGYYVLSNESKYSLTDVFDNLNGLHTSVANGTISSTTIQGNGDWIQSSTDYDGNLVSTTSISADGVKKTTSYDLAGNIAFVDLQSNNLVNDSGITIIGSEFSDVIHGTEFADTLIGGSGDDIIDGHGGGDTVVVDRMSGHDTVIGSDSMTVNVGDDILSSDLSVSLYGNDLQVKVSNAESSIVFKDWITQTDHNIEFLFSDGSSWSENDIVSKLQSFGDGVDIIQAVDPVNVPLVRGGGGDDQLYGLAGSNTLRGDAGNDILNGGADDDFLYGGKGDDQFVFGANSGADTIKDWQKDFSDNDAIIFDSDAISTDFVAIRNGFDLTLQNKVDGASVYVDNYFANINARNGGEIRFSDGAIWKYSDVSEMVSALPSNQGSNASDILYADCGTKAEGFAGDDTIISAGNTIVDGGDGNDIIRAVYAVDSYISGGSGNDNITAATFENSTIDGGDGNDRISVDNSPDNIGSISGGTGQDYIQVEGGGQFDVNGGDDDDTIVFNGSDSRVHGNAGNDIINLYSGSNNQVFGDDGDDRFNVYTSSNTIHAGLGNDVINGSGNDLTIDGDEGKDQISFGGGDHNRIDGGTDSDAIRYGGGNSNYLRGADGDDTIDFGGGVSNVIEGGSGNDVLHFSGGNQNMLAGNDGDDAIVFGGGMDNILDGGSGNDTLTVQGGLANELIGGAGDDTLSAMAGTALLDGGSGIDTLNGSSAADFLYGGKGNDKISTGAGADLLSFNAGDGNDEVILTGKTSNKTITFGRNVDYTSLQLSRSNLDLILSYGENDSITLKGWYDSSGEKKLIGYLQLIGSNEDGLSGKLQQTLVQGEVNTFDFASFVNDFDTSSQNSNVSNWDLSTELLKTHLANSSQEALGGDISFSYASDSIILTTDELKLSSLQDGNFGSERQKFK